MEWARPALDSRLAEQPREKFSNQVIRVGPLSSGSSPAPNPAPLLKKDLNCPRLRVVRPGRGGSNGVAEVEMCSTTDIGDHVTLLE